MICKACGAKLEDTCEICEVCGAELTDDEDISKGAHFIIGKSHDEPPTDDDDENITVYDGSVASASKEFYGNKGKKSKKPVNKGKLAVWITSAILIVLILLSCGYVLFDKLGRNKTPSVTKEDAAAILTAFEGPTLAKIKDKFRTADSDSGREAAREEALGYFKSLEDMGTIESVERTADGTKIYFMRSYTECVFVMDDPTPDTYSASTVLTEEISDAFDGIYSADRDMSNFKLGVENNILILSATENHRSVYDDLDSTLYYFEDASLNVNYIENAALNNFIKDLGQYNMVFIHAQSFIGKDGKTVLALNEKATEANIVGYSYQLANGQSSVYGGMMSENASFTVTDTLIKENYKSVMPNSLVYMSADSGYGTNNTAFADAFAQAGAQIVVGYSDSVSAVYEAKCVKDLTSYIISGKTIADAFEYVTIKNGTSDSDETPAYFGYYGASDWSLYGWELYSGTEATQITSDQELYDSLNYAMLALGTNSISENILGYRIIDADRDGSGELFVMADMGGGLATNLAFDTFSNAQIALDTSKSEDYDYRILYDSANSQVYLCEQFASGNDAKILYSWTNTGWTVFAQYSDEKSGTPTYKWDGKSVSKEAFDSNFQKVSQGALLNNWRNMLNLYYQTPDRDKTVTDICAKFKLMSGLCQTLTADFDGDNSNECAIVISGYGNEWLSNIAIMSRTGKEPILYTQRFGTYVIYIDETDMGVVFRVVYLSDQVREDFTLSADENGGVNLYYEDELKTTNIKFNGEVTDTSGFTVVESYDEAVYSLEGVWSIVGLENTSVTFTAKEDGKIISKNYSFADTDFKEGVFTYDFNATSNTVNILLENDNNEKSYRTFTLQWDSSGNYIALTDHTNRILKTFARIGEYDPSKVPSSSQPDSSGSDSSSGTSSGAATTPGTD